MPLPSLSNLSGSHLYMGLAGLGALLIIAALTIVPTSNGDFFLKHAFLDGGSNDPLGAFSGIVGFEWGLPSTVFWLGVFLLILAGAAYYYKK
jgi:hypothetical protein